MKSAARGGAGSPAGQAPGSKAPASAAQASAALARPAGAGPATSPTRTAAGCATTTTRTTTTGTRTTTTGRAARAILVASALLLIALAVGVCVGPAGLSLPDVAGALLTRLPWHPAVTVPAIDTAIVWQIRLPRVVLGALVGAMLAGGGAAYQGVFRNPLADPYLLGVAAGGGLGATIVIVTGGSPALLPPAAFLGAAAAVTLTYLLGAGAGRAPSGGGRGLGSGTGSILLAGVAVAALLTAVQTYLQQEHSQTLQAVYSWILGGLSLATWSDITMILPYVIVAAGILLAHRRLLDVLRIGETEAGSLGVDVARLRLTVVMAATLGTAAAVSVSGLIGFVGIIVPHAVRLTAGASYRIVLPVSMIGGAAFLVLADVLARTVQSPDEVPIGVITALAGAPFFLFILHSRRARQELA
ncbi:MAG TPA: iron ABC transporter permease [Streptosporangiaceae bacterium]